RFNGSCITYPIRMINLNQPLLLYPLPFFPASDQDLIQSSNSRPHPPVPDKRTELKAQLYCTISKNHGYLQTVWNRTQSDRQRKRSHLKSWHILKSKRFRRLSGSSFPSSSFWPPGLITFQELKRPKRPE